MSGAILVRIRGFWATQTPRPDRRNMGSPFQQGCIVPGGEEDGPGCEKREGFMRGAQHFHILPHIPRLRQGGRGPAHAQGGFQVIEAAGGSFQGRPREAGCQEEVISVKKERLFQWRYRIQWRGWHSGATTVVVQSSDSRALVVSHISIRRTPRVVYALRPRVASC